MASKYAGTKTEQNLKDAFSGESQARNKYTYYASAAKKAGYEQMSALYLETADQEKEHAKMWFKELHGIGTPEENLADAAAGENYEWTDMYARAWHVRHGKRALKSLLLSLNWLQRLRLPMREDTICC